MFGLRVFRIKRRDGTKGTVDRFWLETRRRVPSAILDRGAIWLDGTAHVDVWRAILGPDVKTEIIGASATPVTGVTVTHYVDKSHAKAMHGITTKVDTVADTIYDLEEEAADLESRAPAGMMIPAWWPVGAADKIRQQAALKRLSVQYARASQAARKLRSDSNLHRLWRFVSHQAFTHWRAAAAVAAAAELLLVAQKDVIAALKHLGLPSNVKTAHFGALRGLNGFKSVASAIIVGRTALSTEMLEMQTEALHMHDASVTSILSVAEWPRAPMPLQTRAGLVQITTECHPDPLCQALASTITQAEVRQAVARIRPYDRTPANPCDVHVLGQHDCGLVVDRLALWDAAERSWVQCAIEAGGLFERPESNQRAFGVMLPQGNNGAVLQGVRDDWLRVIGQCFDAQNSAFCAISSNSGHSPIYKYREGFDLSIRDMSYFQTHAAHPANSLIPANDLPEIVHPAGLALAAFTLPPTPDNPRPYKQHAVIRPSMMDCFISVFGHPAQFAWLPANALGDLLWTAFQKRSHKAITEAQANPARHYESWQCRTALTGQANWRETARQLYGF